MLRNLTVIILSVALLLSSACSPDTLDALCGQGASYNPDTKVCEDDVPSEAASAEEPPAEEAEEPVELVSPVEEGESSPAEPPASSATIEGGLEVYPLQALDLSQLENWAKCDGNEPHGVIENEVGKAILCQDIPFELVGLSTLALPLQIPVGLSPGEVIIGGQFIKTISGLVLDSVAFSTAALLTMPLILSGDTVHLPPNLPTEWDPGYHAQPMPIPWPGPVNDVPSIPHTDPEHNPYIKGGQAEKIILAAIAIFASGPNGDQNRCLVLKVGGAAARIIYWSETHLSATSIPRGDLAWVDVLTGVWGGGYSNKSGRTLLDVPDDVKQNNSNPIIEEVDSNNCPPPPPLLAGG